MASSPFISPRSMEHHKNPEMLDEIMQAFADQVSKGSADKIGLSSVYDYLLL